MIHGFLIYVYNELIVWRVPKEQVTRQAVDYNRMILQWSEARLSGWWGLQNAYGERGYCSGGTFI